MAASMKSLETELKVGKALSQIKELEKAFLRVSTNGVNPINRSLAQMNNLLRTSRSLAGGLDKDFKKMANVIASVNRAAARPSAPSPKQSPPSSPAMQGRLASMFPAMARFVTAAAAGITLLKGSFDRLRMKMANVIASVNRSAARSPAPSPKQSPSSSPASLWQLAKSYERSRYRKSKFGSETNKKLFAASEKALMEKIGSSGFSPAMQGRLAAMLPVAARLATLAGAASAAIAGIAAVTSVAAAGVTLLGAAFAGLGIKMVESEVQLAKLQTAFQSQSKAAIEYQKAVLHAARTPFETDEVINAVVQMQVFQVNAFERIGKSGRQLVDILGDMAGATGTDLATATHALQRAMVGEWEIMQNNFQISARMIPQLKGLSTGTAEYKKAIIDYLEQQGRFIGGQEIMAKSLRGMWSNIKDAATNLITFTAGVADSKAELANVTLYDKFRESLFGIYDAVSRPDVLNQYANLMAEVNAGGKDGAIAMGKLIDALGDEEKAKKLLNIANNKNIKSEYQRIQALKAAGFEEDQIYSRGQKIVAMGQMLGQIMKVVYTATFKPVLEGIGNALDWVLRKFENVGKMLLGDKMFKRSVVKNAEDAKKSLTQIALSVGQQWGISAETMAGGIEKVVAGMGERGKQFDKEIRERGIHTLNDWQRLVMVFSVIMELVSLLIEDKLGGVFTLFRQLGKGFSEGFSFITDGTFSALFEQFSSMIKGLGLTNEEVTGDMMGSWRAWGQVIGNVAGAVMTAIAVTTSTMLMFGRITWNVLQIITRLITTVGELLTGNFEAAGQTIQNIGGDFVDIFSAVKDYAGVLAAANTGLGKLMPNQEGINRPDAYALAAEDKAQIEMSKGQKDNEKERKKDAEDQKKLMERQILATKQSGRGGSQSTTINYYGGQGPEKDPNSPFYKQPGPGVELPPSIIDTQKQAVEKADKVIRESGGFKTNPSVGSYYVDTTGRVRVVEGGILGKKQKALEIDGYEFEYKNGNLVPIPVSRAVGAFNLPYDQAVFAHKGEMIIPAREAEYLRSMITPNDGFRQGASLAGAMIPAALGGGSSVSKIINAPTVNQYFMGQSGSRVATQLYGEAQNLAKQVVSS